jgi:negative regulator of sigma-B (phosphoserine phosphatase)
MTAAAAATASVSVDWVSVPKSGESECGDAVVVRTEGDRTLLAVIDVLGHGKQAADVARIAVEFLRTVPLAGGGGAMSGGVMAVIEGLHERLRGTRGAAAMVCIISGGTLEGCGVGNVELRCQRGRVPIVLTPGVIGAQIKRARAFRGGLPEGDRIVIFTDGISSRFSLKDLSRLSPGEACREILERGRRIHDDATVLVADIGRPS